MKLKMEVLEQSTVLAVSEGVEMQNIPVLKAGLNKLFAADRKTVLLDLSSLDAGPQMSPEIREALAGLVAWAAGSEAQLLIVSTGKDMGAFSTRDEAIKALNSPMAKLLALEAGLNARISELTRRKGAMEAQLGAISGAAGGNDVTELQKQNSDLKHTIKRLEGLLLRRFKVRASEPVNLEALKSKNSMLTQTLEAVLAKEGISV